MFKKMLVIAAIGTLAGCDKRPEAARQIVRNELRGPQAIEFRNVRVHAKDNIVCGEVLASDKPHGGWRHFVAYTDLGRAAVAPSSEIISADAEMSNPLLKGEAERFNHACD